MYCQSCGARLPTGANACPNCGTFTPVYYAPSDSSPHSPTKAAAPGTSSNVEDPLPSSTQYGSNPYETNPYDANSYNIPPPPSPPRKVSPIRLGIITVLVLLIALSSIGFVLFRNNQSKTNLSPTATSSTGSSILTATSSIGSTVGSANADITATATAFYGVYDTDTNSVLPKDDPLSDNTKGFQWDERQGCAFKGGTYHVSNLQSSSFQVCMAHNSNFANFVYQVQMTIVKGSYGSLIFRANKAVSNFYIFRVGQDGVFTVAAYTNNTDTEIKHGPSLAFKQGPNQTNLLTVIAQGPHLIFYVNSQYVYDMNDTSFSSGEIGLVAGSIGDPTEVIYNNAKIWVL